MYSDKTLYTQLCYYAYLFDAAQALEEVSETSQRHALRDRLETHKADMEVLRATVDAFLARNGRRYVGLGKLFSFLRV